MNEGNLAFKQESGEGGKYPPKESAKVYYLQDLIEHPKTEAEIDKEVARLAEVRDRYMDEVNLASPINVIKKALALGDRDSAEKIRENNLDLLETELLFIKDGVDPRIDLEKKKLESVKEYYCQLF